MNKDLLSRAVCEVVPMDVAKAKLSSGKPMRVYLGIDPTGSKLHIGHAVPLRKLRQFQDAGHTVVFLVGSFTAMIGDPSGRDAMREPLTMEKVKENFETYKDQAAKILDFSKVEVRYNHEWLEQLNFADVLNLAGTFTVQQMLKRDMFQERMKKDMPIAITEFLYPLMQGYDSVALDVDCEVGGSDQLFNMLAGRTIMQQLKNKEKFVLTTKLIEGLDGRKMSKTYDNCVWLEDSAKDMYGKLMSAKDELITVYLECCTDVPMEEIVTMEKEMKNGANPRDFKVRMAKEIVAVYHGKAEAEKAAEGFTAQFTKGEVPEDMQEISVKKGQLLIDVLVEHKLVASKSEVKRLITQKGIAVDDKIVSSIDTAASAGVVRIGKRTYVRFV